MAGNAVRASGASSNAVGLKLLLLLTLHMRQFQSSQIPKQANSKICYSRVGRATAMQGLLMRHHLH